jgi:hypothetical protein
MPPAKLKKISKKGMKCSVYALGSSNAIGTSLTGKESLGATSNGLANEVVPQHSISAAI